jgi:hypothetical protein
MTWFLIFLLLLVGVAAGGLAWFSYSTGTPVASIFFRPRPERRLEVVEQASLDSRRKLVIVRRDNVEHLIMTGGPVDVVIETGIGATAPRPRLATSEGAEATPVYSRPARGLGQAAGE